MTRRAHSPSRAFQQERQAGRPENTHLPGKGAWSRSLSLKGLPHPCQPTEGTSQRQKGTAGPKAAGGKVHLPGVMRGGGQGRGGLSDTQASPGPSAPPHRHCLQVSPHPASPPHGPAFWSQHSPSCTHVRVLNAHPVPNTAMIRGLCPKTVTRACLTTRVCTCEYVHVYPRVLCRTCIKRKVRFFK